MTLGSDRISKALLQVLLGVLFLLSAIHFLDVAIRFGRDLLQMDFSAYYTAGQALNYGLSPYLNNLSNQPPLWDGIAHFGFSRFLYPPLVAKLFQPLALIPYPVAKYLWEVFTLACLAVSLYLTAREFPLKSFGQVFAVGAAVCLYYPLQAHLDRGQIDLVTLLILTGSILLMLNRTARSDLWAGGLLVFATLLKLNCIYVLPFLALQRKWQVLKGYAAGGLVLVVASVVLFLGPRSLYDYVRYQLPRISGVTTVDDKLGKTNSAILASLRRNLAELDTVKDGTIYHMSYFTIVNYATLATPVWYLFTGLDWNLSRTMVSLLLFALFFAVCWWWNRRYGHLSPPRQWEFLFWQIPILLILLTAPLTWVMNTVWLLPFTVILASLLPANPGWKHLLPLLAMSLGFILVMLNNNGFEFLNRWWLDKSMIGELILLASLLAFLSLPAESQPADPAREKKG